MNRFFRTSYSAALAAFFATLTAVTAKGLPMPLLSFSCIYFGLLVFMLPHIVPRLEGRETLFGLVGAAVMAAGVLFVVRMPAVYVVGFLICLAAAYIFIPLLRHQTTHSDFEAKFRFSLICAGCFTALLMVGGLTEKNIFEINPDNVKQALVSAVPVAILLLASGVLLLRGLRAQQGIVDVRAFNRRQLRDTLIFSGIVTAVFAADPFRWLSQAADYIYEKLLKPLRYLIEDGLRKLFELMRNPHPPQYDPGAYTEPPADLVNVTPSPPPEIQPTPDPTDVAKNSDDLMKTLLTIFMIVAMAAVLIFVVCELVKLIKKLMQNSKPRGSGYPNEERSALPPDDEGPKEDRPNRFSRDPRRRIRYHYREYMHHLRSKKIPIAPSDTCTDINQRARHTLRRKKSETEELTEIYRRARYRMGSEPERADAERMKQLVNDIKNDDR
ncbi:MAG: DUF4129 domain-containing protein [Clostridia bacterium]|nr:DUF4129 domain-containing protein [Clostridia bacterium]